MCVLLLLNEVIVILCTIVMMIDWAATTNCLIDEGGVDV